MISNKLSLILMTILYSMALEVMSSPVPQLVPSAPAPGASPLPQSPMAGAPAPVPAQPPMAGAPAPPPPGAPEQNGGSRVPGLSGLSGLTGSGSPELPRLSGLSGIVRQPDQGQLSGLLGNTRLPGPLTQNVNLGQVSNTQSLTAPVGQTFETQLKEIEQNLQKLDEILDPNVKNVVQRARTTLNNIRLLPSSSPVVKVELAQLQEELRVLLIQKTGSNSMTPGYEPGKILNIGGRPGPSVGIGKYGKPDPIVNSLLSNVLGNVSNILNKTKLL